MHTTLKRGKAYSQPVLRIDETPLQTRNSNLVPRRDNKDGIAHVKENIALSRQVEIIQAEMDLCIQRIEPVPRNILVSSRLAWLQTI